jgi:hypothetical protein
VRKVDKPGAFAAYKAGIEANIQAVEERCAEWVAGDPSLATCPSFAPATQEAIDNYLNTAIGTAADITMGKIITQKLMTMMWSSEQWNDMRRFDYDPQIFMNYGKPMWYTTHGTALKYCPEGAAPRRLPQASYEVDYNTGNLEAIGAQVPGALELPVIVSEDGTRGKWYNSDQIRTLPVWWDSTQE